MIYRLMKRQLPWKWLLGFSAFFAAAALFRIPSMAFLPATIAMLALTAPSWRQRCAAFEAALPIRGQDLFLARLAGNLAVIWSLLLPAFATAALSNSGAKAAGLTFVFEVCAILTLATVAIQSVDTGRFKSPLWWQVVVAVVAELTIFAVLAAFLGFAPHLGAYLPAGYIAAACMLGAAALFLKTLKSVPAALQSESREPQAFPTDRARWPKRLLLPSSAWSPILRMVLSFKPLLLSFWCAMAILTRASLWYMVMLFVLTSSFVLSELRNLSWVLALPISRHKIFLGLCSQTLIGLVVGSFSLWISSRPFISPEPATQMFFDLAITAIAFLSGFIAMRGLADRQLFPWRFRLTLGIILLLFALVFAIIRGHGLYRIQLGRELLARIPGHTTLWMVVAACAVAAFYWLAYQAFRNLEVSALPVIPYSPESRRLY